LGFHYHILPELKPGYVYVGHVLSPWLDFIIIFYQSWNQVMSM